MTHLVRYAAISTLCALTLLSTGCQTFTPQQASANADVLADAFVEHVWDIDPEIYFDDERLRDHDFTYAPRAMKRSEYHGNALGYVSTPSGDNIRFQEARIFALDLPLTRANAQDSDRQSSEFPALVCLMVSAKYEKEVAVYQFELFAPTVADDRNRRNLVRNGSYVADLESRAGYAIPVSADRLIARLHEHGLPLEFRAGVFAVTEDHEPVAAGAEFLLGSGRLTVTENPAETPRRLGRLQAQIELPEGLTARELYRELLAIEEIRQPLAEQARSLTAYRRSTAERNAASRIALAEERAREKRRSQARASARAGSMLAESANESARDLNRWSQRQFSGGGSGGNYGGGSGASTYQRDLDEKLEQGRVNARIAAHERKMASQARQVKLERDRRAKEKLERAQDKLQDEADDFEDEWNEFTRSLVFIGRDLKRTEFADVRARHEQLIAERDDLAKRLEAAGLDAMHVPSQDVWFTVNERELERRKKGVRSTILNMRAPRGEGWNEHLVATIAGVEFYQRVRNRTFPDKVVDLTWRVINTNDHPVWHQLDESKPHADARSYLWGGSDLKPGGSHLHQWVTYERDRVSWQFEGFVRRED